MSPRIATDRGVRLQILRAAACLLLAAIAFDLLADARCDVAPSAVSSPIRVGEQGQRPDGTRDTGEPCSRYCVPDCFCCSRSVAAGTVIVAPARALPSTLDAPAQERCSEGFRPVVDHPPLRLA